MTQNLKFPSLRDWMDSSRKIIPRKIVFPWNNSFLSDMSHVHKSTKMRFPGNPPKVVQLQNSRKSAKMVVWGWYMTHFDRKNFLNSKKICLGGFRNLSDLQRSIREFLGFFWEISSVAQNPKNPSASTLDLEIFFQKWFSCKSIWMRENIEL